MSAIFRASLFLLLLSSTPLCHRTRNSGGAFAQNLQDYVDQYTGEIRSFDPSKELTIIIRNKSQHVADIHTQGDSDSVKLESLGTLGVDKQLKLDINLPFSFFVTRHGMKEPLLDPATEEQLQYEVSMPNQIFHIPENAAPVSSINACTDRYNYCQTYANQGLCDKSPGWMIVNCCESCDEELNGSLLIDANIRCSRERLGTETPIWQPGDLNKLFTKWVVHDQRKLAKYNPQVLSSPGGKYGGKNGPWLLQLDNYLTDFHIKDFLLGGQTAGYHRATQKKADSMNTVGETQNFVSSSRTGSNTWCIEECQGLQGVKSAFNKVSRLSGIPRNHFEMYEILKYEVDEFYVEHHDCGIYTQLETSGPRVMTFFFFLSDVEEGGETYFNNLDITIKPKKGRLLIWPSVLDSDPTVRDDRMVHETKPVIKGKHHAVNQWIHLFDFATSNKWGCTGNFI